MRLRVLIRPISTSFLLVTQWTCSDRNSLEVHPKQLDSPWRLTRLTPDEWDGIPRVTGKSPEPCCATHGVIDIFFEPRRVFNVPGQTFDHLRSTYTPKS